MPSAPGVQPGLFQQRLRLFGIVVVLRLGLRIRPRTGVDGRIDDPRVTQVQPIDDGLAVYRVVERLADLYILKERIDQIELNVAIPSADHFADREALVVAEALELDDGHGRGHAHHVKCAGAHQRRQRRGVGHGLDDESIDFWLATPVLGVSRAHHLVVGTPVGEFERTGADRAASRLVLTEVRRRNRAVDALRQDRLKSGDRQEWPVRRRQLHLDGARIRRRDPADSGGSARLEGGRAIDVGEIARDLRAGFVVRVADQLPGELDISRCQC